eukprot:GFYU01000547.1.p1 GENE.GFYU01000547.1~~GFYU01000547.1.p1  ORF type:complete len:526 (+),score=123.66 GFYU01000547.1:136-1713(+)
MKRVAQRRTASPTTGNELLAPAMSSSIELPGQTTFAASAMSAGSLEPATPLDPAVEHLRLPLNLKRRLTKDLSGGDIYWRVEGGTANLRMRKANSSYSSNRIATFLGRRPTLIRDGEIGRIRVGARFEFLGPGYHSYMVFGLEFFSKVPANVLDEAKTNGPSGFVTISDGKLGVLLVGSDFKLLAPGTYQWASPIVRFEGSIDITKERASLGPYDLVTVPAGQCAVTYNNGELVILGQEGETQAGGGESAMFRTFFLDDPKWTYVSMLSTSTQTDRLDGNDLLSRDNVELIMVAMSQWRIINPHLAATNCASDMETIRVKVNQLVRAAIARIVGATRIGAGPVTGSVKEDVEVLSDGGGPGGAGGPGTEKEQDESLAYLMQSSHAHHHMADLRLNMKEMGIEVTGVFVPEKRMKNDDIRQQVAKQAVIGIKAEAERSAADASAYAKVRLARADAEAIEVLAKAHSEAGQRLGNPNDTAARLALTESTSKALQGTKLTIFSGMPGNIPFMLNDSTAAGTTTGTSSK